MREARKARKEGVPQPEMPQPPVEEVAQPERQDPQVEEVLPPAREAPIVIDLTDYKQYTMSHDEFKHACRAVTADG